MDRLSRLQKELVEIKKFQTETSRREPREDLTEVALCLASLDNKIQKLEKEEAQFKEELAQLKTKKVQLRQKFLTLDEECECLQVDLEYLNKENTSLMNQVAVYEEKIKLCKSYCIAPSDLEKINRDTDKTNIFRRFTGIKFVGFPDGSEIEGSVVYNEKSNYIKHFKLNKDENDGKLWKIIKEARHADWTHLETEIKEELLQKH